MVEVAAFIPARGGSKRIPHKNLQHVGRESLLSRSIRVAWEGGCNRVVVSTEDAGITDHALWCTGVEVHQRPVALADEFAQIESAIEHWLLSERRKPDVIVLLQPTSPFRRPSTIKACIEGALEHGASNTVTRASEAWFSGRTSIDGGSVVWQNNRRERPRSQDLGRIVREDGCVYAFTASFFGRWGLRMQTASTQAPVFIEEWESFEIDTPTDLLVAQRLEGVINELR